MEKSIFELIIDREIPSLIVYEDDKYIAILDISPKQKGHTLLIPKKKSINVLEDQEAQQDILVLGSKLAKQIRDNLKASGVRLVFNNGASAGQEVFHTHLHIVPYYDTKVEAINNESVLEEINGNK